MYNPETRAALGTGTKRRQKKPQQNTTQKTKIQRSIQIHLKTKAETRFPRRVNSTYVL
jgi:hypothetical protein